MDLKKAAVRKAQRKPSPKSIPLSDRDEVRKRDYYAVLLRDADCYRFFITFLDETHIEGLWFNTPDDSGGRGNPACLSTARLACFSLEIVHYYGELAVTYNTPVDFLQKNGWYPRLHLAKARYIQWRYNLRPLAKDDRYRILSFIYKQSCETREFRFSPWSYMEKRHGPLWAGHPSGEKILNHYQFLLESLVASGELEEDDYGLYKLKAAALASLSEYENNAERHAEAVAQQRTLAGLTYALVLVGVGQIVVALVK